MNVYKLRHIVKPIGAQSENCFTIKKTKRYINCKLENKYTQGTSKTTHI